MSRHKSNRFAGFSDDSALSTDSSQASFTDAVLGRDPVGPRSTPSPTTGHGNPSEASSPELAPKLRQWRSRRQASSSDDSDYVHDVRPVARKSKAKNKGKFPSSGSSDYTASAKESSSDDGDDEIFSERSASKSSGRAASSHKSQDAPTGTDTSDAASLEESYHGLGYPRWKPKRASVRDCESDCTEVSFWTMGTDLDGWLKEMKADGESWGDISFVCRRNRKTCKARWKWLKKHSYRQCPSSDAPSRDFYGESSYQPQPGEASSKRDCEVPAAGRAECEQAEKEEPRRPGLPDDAETWKNVEKWLHGVYKEVYDDPDYSP